MQRGVKRYLIKESKAFTLLELMIAVAIVAIMAGIAFPAYKNFTRDAQLSEGVRILGEAWRAQQEFTYREGAGGSFTECFNAMAPTLECLKNTNTPLIPPQLGYIPPISSRFNLMIGDAGDVSDNGWTSTAFFMTEDRRLQLGLGTSSTYKGNKFGWTSDEDEFWMGTETYIDQRYELIGMRIKPSTGQVGLVSLCERGAYGAAATEYQNGFESTLICDEDDDGPPDPDQTDF